MDIEVNFNVGIVDQQISGLLNERTEEFSLYDGEERRKSAAFVVLCMHSILDVSVDDALEHLTDGGEDAGIDGIFVGDDDDGEFIVWLFQGKYKKRMDGLSAFSETDITQIASTVRSLFTPDCEMNVNGKVLPFLEEIRSRVRDGLIPNVKIVLCNNGQKWNAKGDAAIAAAGLPAGQVEFIHYNHDSIISVLKKTKPVDAMLRLQGPVIEEGFKFKRILVSRISVPEIAALFDQHGDHLLERNVRRYLGLATNRVNNEISRSLQSEDRRDDFYFYNNGITAVCSKFNYDRFQRENCTVTVKGLQIINGGQTCKTIQLTLNAEPSLLQKTQNTSVLLRLYELESEDVDFIRAITYATNSQNPVDLRDLHANDDVQRDLAIGIKELGYTYRHKRDESAPGGNDVLTSAVIAEAVLAVWRHCPHQSKFMRREHFGKLYAKIFQGLNSEQAVMASLIYRLAENERKRPTLAENRSTPYSSHYLAMRMGILLLRSCDCQLNNLHHGTYQKIMADWERNKKAYYGQAAEDIEAVLQQTYVDYDRMTLQQLSATFRRGDLIDRLIKM